MGIEGPLPPLDRRAIIKHRLPCKEGFDELAAPPNYGLHERVGDRAGRWAMTVTKNWRLTFIRIDETTIADLDLEDYH